MNTTLTPGQRSYAQLKRKMANDSEYRNRYIQQRRRDQKKSYQVIKQRQTALGIPVTYVAEQKPTQKAGSIIEVAVSNVFNPLDTYNYPFNELRVYKPSKKYKVNKGELMQTIRITPEESLVLQRALTEFLKTTMEKPASTMIGMSHDQAMQYQHDCQLMVYTHNLVTKLNSGAYE